MGSTSTHREPGQKTADFLGRELLHPYQKFLATGMDGSTFYAAVQNGPDAPYEPGKVWGLVVLAQWGSGYWNYTWKAIDEDMGPAEAGCPAKVLDLLSPLPGCQHAEQYCRFCDSLITERDGQWVYTPTEGQVPECGGPRCYCGYPVSARQEDGSAPFHEPGGTAPCSTCHARNWRERCRARLARISASKAVTAGTTVKFSRSFTFTDGFESDMFTFVEKNTFHADGRRYRIPGWRETTFEAVPAA